MCLLFVVTLLTSFAYAQQLPMPQGVYGKGSLLHAWHLAEAGEGFVRLFVERNRGWGSQPMIEMIERSALEMSQQFPMRDRLQIGDISSKRGGRISRHASHQNGLDADVIYYRLNGMEQGLKQRRGFAESFVRRGKLSSNFDVLRNWELMKTLHRYGKVQRIFVDRVIKRAFCNHARKNGEFDIYSDVLRSMRPYPAHHDHFHVRLHCPDYAEKCKRQVGPAVGTGC